jgi:hypothetical protein
MRPKFCRECGAETVAEWTGSYSEQTGEKIMCYVCGANRCHHGHDERATGKMFGPDWKCSRCGETGNWATW